MPSEDGTDGLFTELEIRLGCSLYVMEYTNYLDHGILHRLTKYLR